MAYKNVRIAMDCCGDFQGICVKSINSSERSFHVSKINSSLKSIVRLVYDSMERMGLEISCIKEMVLTTGPGRLTGVKTSMGFALGFGLGADGVSIFGMNRLDVLSHCIDGCTLCTIILKSHGHFCFMCRYDVYGMIRKRVQEPICADKSFIFSAIQEDEVVMGDLPEIRSYKNGYYMNQEDIVKKVTNLLVDFCDRTLYFEKDIKPFFLRPFRLIREKGGDRIAF